MANVTQWLTYRNRNPFGINRFLIGLYDFLYAVIVTFALGRTV